MYVKLVLALTVFCAVISRTKSERSFDARPFMQSGYARMKRGKYYSYPQRFYSRPPVSFPDRGVISYTPPPNYSPNDDESPYPGPPGSRPSKVSKRPINVGLGDDDISNIVKYLSKKDLAKLIDIAGGKERDKERYSNDLYPGPATDNFNSEKYYSNPVRDDDSNTFKGLVQEIDIDLKDSTPHQQELKPFSVEYNRKPNAKPFQVEYDSKPESKPFQVEYDSKPESKPFQVEYDSKPESKPFQVEYDRKPEPVPFKIEYNIRPTPPLSIEYNPSGVNYVTQPTPPQAHFTDTQNNQLYDTAALEAEESMLKNQIAFLKSQIKDGVVHTDSQTMPEETLPKPMNLREDQDFDVSNTNNVPTVVKAEQSSSYKLENFGELPLMNYNAKLDTLSSYHVPHYTVTSGSKLSPVSSYLAQSSVPIVEPAPPPSAAKAQSDAHLKAVRIWSHRSKGTAYTLHDDGTLSLEKPGRPNRSYGFP